MAGFQKSSLASSTSVANPVMKNMERFQPKLDLTINNVVCTFSVSCELNLQQISLAPNMEYHPDEGMVTTNLRQPNATASIRASGEVSCTGTTSEEDAKKAARKIARIIKKIGFPVKFQDFQVVHVLGTCCLPWAVQVLNFTKKHKHNACYVSEIQPGVLYKLAAPKATLTIYCTGSVTVTAASVGNVKAAIEHIFPLVFEFRKRASDVVSASAMRTSVASLAEKDNRDNKRKTPTDMGNLKKKYYWPTGSD